jgi:hypothetical protein
MAASIISKPLSSAFVGGQNFASWDADRLVGALGWRSEAFAEDLVGEMPPAAPTADPGYRWLGTLQCVLPLALALAGGVMAFVTLGM